MPLLPSGTYRKTRGIIRRGTRVNQPAANTVLEGTLYHVTDEQLTERSNGSAWESYSGISASELVTTAIGNQDDFNFNNASLLICNNSSLLTIRGLLAGIPGQLLTIISTGAGQVYFNNQDLNSSANNRIITGVAGNISIIQGKLILIYNGNANRWYVTNHEQGNWIDVPYSITDFAAIGGTGTQIWDVEIGDVLVHTFLIDAAKQLMHVSFDFFLTSLSSTGALSTVLTVKIPGGMKSKGKSSQFAIALDNGVIVPAVCDVNSPIDDTVYRIALQSGGSWSASVNNTRVRGGIFFNIKQS